MARTGAFSAPNPPADFAASRRLAGRGGGRAWRRWANVRVGHRPALGVEFEGDGLAAVASSAVASSVALARAMTPAGRDSARRPISEVPRTAWSAGPDTPPSPGRPSVDRRRAWRGWRGMAWTATDRRNCAGRGDRPRWPLDATAGDFSDRRPHGRSRSVSMTSTACMARNAADSAVGVTGDGHGMASAWRGRCACRGRSSGGSRVTEHRRRARGDLRPRWPPDRFRQAHLTRPPAARLGRHHRG